MATIEEQRDQLLRRSAPRGVLSDYLQDFKFWLFDVAPIEALSIPLFSPVMGFSSITAPSIRADIKEIKEGNWYFARKSITGGSADPITLQRAATFYNHDFYRWMMAGLTGDTGGTVVGNNPSFSGVGSIGGPTPRRTLVLVQFFPRSPFDSPAANIAASMAGITALTGVAAGSSNGAIPTLQAMGQTIGAVGAAEASLGPFDFAVSIPAKAWVLYGCLPSSYKPVQQFDANSSDISLAELEIEMEGFDELSLSDAALSLV